MQILILTWHYLLKLFWQYVNIRGAEMTYGCESRNGRLYLNNTPNHNAKILLVDKSLCFEQSEVLPVDNSLEAYKLSKLLNIHSPFKGCQVAWVREYEDQFIANISVLRLDVETQYWFALPMHWAMLGELGNNEQFEYSIEQADGSHKACITRVDNTNGIIKATHSHSASFALDTCLYESEGAFDIKRLERDDALQRLKAGLFKIPFNTWLHARLSHQHSQSRVNWRAWIVSFALVSSVYLVLSSVGLISANYFYQVQANNANQEAIEVAKLRRELLNQIATIESRLDAHQSVSDMMLLWDTLLPMLQNEVNITALNVSSGKVEVFGNAPQASAVMQLLEERGIDDAEFIAAIRENRRLQRQNFAIGFTLPNDSPVTAPEAMQ